MNYELFLVNNSDIYSFKDKLIAYLKEAELDVQARKYETTDYTYFHLGCTLFDINIDIAGKDFEEDTEEEIKLCRKYYGVEINTSLHIFLYSKTFNPEGWIKLLHFLSKILNSTNDDLLLLDDTSFPVLKRTNNKLMVNNKLDEYNQKYITEEKLKNLNYPYSFQIFKNENE